MKKIKLAKVLKFIGIIIALVLLLSITILGIPYLINSMLYLPIETHNSTDGDWLSFWGSFLGGILGGLGTLLGVWLTLVKSNNDRKEFELEEKIKRQPRLIPIKKQFHMLYDGNIIYSSNNYKKSIDGFDLLELKFINASKEVAIDIEVNWDPPTEKEILGSKELSKDEATLLIRTLKEYNPGSEVDKKIEFITSLGECVETINPYLNIIIDQVSKVFLQYHIEKGTNILMKKDIPLGSFKISCENVYGELTKLAYNINISIYSVGSDINQLFGTLTFYQVR